jgi:hypothetical protein
MLDDDKINALTSALWMRCAFFQRAFCAGVLALDISS